MARILDRLKYSKSIFAKNLVTIMSGTVVVQVISFLTLPLISRLYSPEAFGEFGMFVAILGPIGMLITMGYELAILKPKGELEALGIAVLCLVLTGLYSVGTLFFLLIFRNTLITYFELVESKYFLLFTIPIFIVLQGIGVVLRYWSLRKGYFKNMALASIASTSSDKLIVLLFGMLGKVSGISLLLGNLFDALVKPIVLFHKTRTELKWEQLNTSWSNLKKIGKKFRKYPIYILPTNIISRLNADSYLYFLIILFSQSVVGSYMLCLRILKMPLTLISSSLGEVYFQRISSNSEGGNILFKRIMRMSVYISFLPFLLMTIISQDIFIWFLGDQWQFAGRLAQIISISVFFEFISSLTPYTMININKENFVLIQRIGLFTASLISILIGYSLASELVTFLALSILVSMVYYITIIWTIRAIRIQSMFFHSLLFSAFGFSVPFLVLIYYIKYIIGIDGIYIALIGLFLVVIHHSLQISFNKTLRSDLKTILN
jgi:O-antigen/teichoic acid export membrane protein